MDKITFIKRNLLCLFVILLVLLTGIAGCGASPKSSQSPMNAMPTEEAAYDYDAATATAVSYDASSSEQEKKLTHYWDFSLQVKNSSAAMNQITKQVEKLGGYLVESRINKNKDESHRAYLMVKIPQDKMTTMVNFLRELGYVIDEGSSVQDVSEEYYDTQARLKVLSKQEERLLGFMDKYAGNIEDLLAVEKEISRVRGERESLQARMNYLENSVAYSRFSIDIKEGQMGQLTAPSGTMGKAYQGLVKSLNSMLQLFNWLFIGLFMALPYLLVIALAFFLYRAIKKKKSKND